MSGRPSVRAWRRRALGVSVAAVLAASACTTSRGLATAAEDKPGVVAVEVGELDGDDLGTPKKRVLVTMEGDASAAQVEAVLEEYDDEIADESVETVTVILEGAGTGSLVVGHTTERTPEMVATLVAAMAEPDIGSIAMENYTGGMDVRLDLDAGGLDRVSAAVDEYWDRLAPATDAMEDATLIVQSGGFRVIRSKKDPTLLARRIAVAQRVDRRHGLVGADISSSVEMTLRVASSGDVRAVQGLLGSVADGDEVGRIDVVKETVDLSGATGDLEEHVRYVVDRIRNDPSLRFARVRDGVLQIGADTVEDALNLDSYFDGVNDPHLLAIPVRYVVARGDFGKTAGASLRYFGVTELSEQSEWIHFSLTDDVRGRSVRVHALGDVTHGAAARALAAVAADTARVIWPSASGYGPLTLTPAGRDGREVEIGGDVSEQQEIAIREGWAAGAP